MITVKTKSKSSPTFGYPKIRVHRPTGTLALVNASGAAVVLESHGATDVGYGCQGDGRKDDFWYDFTGELTISNKAG